MAKPTHAETTSTRVSRFAWAAAPLAFIFAWATHRLATGGGTFELGGAWVASLGVDFRLVFDGLSLFFLALIAGVGTCVFVYAAGYLGDDPNRRRLFAWLTAFTLAMFGTVGADDLIVLYVFWELTSLSSFMLVSFHHESELARRSARQAMMVTFGGGFVMLLGIILLAQATGTTSTREMIEARALLDGDPLALFGMFCLIAGAFTKSAQFPFHFWLPNAMAAPTPVSAYLHSATMVKLGVYLLARMEPVFAEQWLFSVTLIVIGGVTSLWAMLQTVRERDLKRILAWSTVSALGTMVMLVGLPGPESAMALVAFVMAHALYKAPLFFVAGNIDHCTGTRDIGHLAGLAGSMPWTAAVALAAAVSMGGLPLSFGHFAKELIHVAKSGGDLYVVIGYGSIPVSAITLAVAAIAAIRIFWHRGGAEVPEAVHDAPASMRLPPLVLAAVGVFLGVFPEVAEPLIAAAAGPVTPHGAELVASDASAGLSSLLPVYALGVLVFASWDRIHRATAKLRLPEALQAAENFERSQRLAVRLAGVVTRGVQRGRLGGYVALSSAALAAGLAYAAFEAAPIGGFRELLAEAARAQASGATIAVVGAAALLVAASGTLPLLRDSFVLLLISGMMGVGLALVFLFSGAPDLAFTQFIVEVALVVVIASVLLRVRRLGVEQARERSPWLRAAIAALVGAGVTALTLIAHGAGTASTALREYFGEKALAEAHGRNVVNVILVDFRALDTLGEIAVLIVAFLATARIFTVFRKRSARAE